MKYLLAVILLVCSTNVFADRVDALDIWTAEDYCELTSQEFFGGMDSQHAGFGRAIKNFSEDIMELAERGLPLPKDAMYVPQWDGLNDHEKDFIKKHTFEGWDEAAKIPELSEEMALNMKEVYKAGCVAQREKETKL